MLYTYLSVDAVPRRIWVKPCAIYTPEYRNTWDSLLITGQPSSSPVMSSIFSHLNTTGHSADFDDFEILSSCSDNCELLIHESLLISKLKPSLLTSRAALFRLTFCNLPLSSVLFPELYRPVIHTPSYLLLSLVNITPCK